MKTQLTENYFDMGVEVKLNAPLSASCVLVHTQSAGGNL